MGTNSNSKVLVIVAHPDDETIWAGGTLLAHPQWQVGIVSLCRGDDADRRPKFFNALEVYRAKGEMASLEDGPEQGPLDAGLVKETILKLVEEIGFGESGLVISHSPLGEYSRHRRHEETGEAVCSLWAKGELKSQHLHLFAYTDEDSVIPHPSPDAELFEMSGETWREKQRIITSVYGFKADSFEARAAAETEAFWCFGSRRHLAKWLKGKVHESFGSV